MTLTWSTVSPKKPIYFGFKSQRSSQEAKNCQHGSWRSCEYSLILVSLCCRWTVIKDYQNYVLDGRHTCRWRCQERTNELWRWRTGQIFPPNTYCYSSAARQAMSLSPRSKTTSIINLSYRISKSSETKLEMCYLALTTGSTQSVHVAKQHRLFTVYHGLYGSTSCCKSD